MISRRLNGGMPVLVKYPVGGALLFGGNPRDEGARRWEVYVSLTAMQCLVTSS